jgi:RNA polymerase sigma-70 factor (ECF subfamily)
MVTECAAALVLYARQWLDGASADDAVQDALVALLTEKRPPRNPKAWIYRAVRNAAIDAARATERRLRREQSVARTRREWFDTQPDLWLDAQTAEQLLRRLSPEHREVVVLRIWGDLGFAEIAQIMELGVTTVYDRYKVALRELRSALEQPCPRKTE